MAKRSSPAPLLIVSDVDGTVLGDEVALQRFAAWWEPRSDWVLLAYNSGRFVESIAESVRDTDLPQPHAMIGGVGTQVELTAKAERGPHRLLDWPTRSSRWTAAKVQEILSSFSELEMQPAYQQSEFKISYYGYDLTAAVLEQIEAALASAELPASVIYSSNRDLDILPTGIHKGTAAGRLSQELAIPPDRVIVCGDTGNDLAMFREGYHGVVVGNAHPELKSLSGPRVYQAKAGFAAGVQEGVIHWSNQWGTV